MSFASYRRHTTWTLPAIPDLWAEARRLFARAVANTGAPPEIAQSVQLPRARRHEIVLWIEPVEKMVRGLIAAKAVIHLLMTPEGRKLLREARRDCPAPEPDPEPPKPQSAPHSRRIPHPGWHTIWQPPPKPALPQPEPLSCVAAPPQPEATPPSLHDPSSWSCPYRVVSRIPAQGQAPPICMPESRRPRIALLDDWVTPPPKPDAANFDPDDEDTAGGSTLAFRYARRIETLRRVLENPEPAIRRLARVLAKTPDDLDLPRWRNEAARRRWQSWRQGDLYADQTREHALLALRALHLSLEWLDGPRDESG